MASPGSWGLQIGGICIIARGSDRWASPPAFAAIGAPTLELDAIESINPLRLERPAVVEMSRWSAAVATDEVEFLLVVAGSSNVGWAKVKANRQTGRGQMLYQPEAPFSPFGYPLDRLLTLFELERVGGLLMHAAGIAGGDAGVLLVGPSHAGKTTLSRAVAALPGIRVLSDERIALRPSSHGWLMDGTPWYGDGKFALQLTVPLRAIFFLDKCHEDAIVPVGAARAVASLLQCHVPASWERDGVSQALTRFERLVSEVPSYRLRHRLGGRAPYMLAEKLGLGVGEAEVVRR